MAKEAAKTGAGPTALIAIEQYFPKKERIVEDDLAYQILPFGRVFLWLWRVIEDISYEEMAGKYVKPTGRLLAATPIERMVYAEKV